MSKKEIKHFHRFLKENGYFTIWMKNVRNTQKISIYKTYADYNCYLECIPKNDVVLWCFEFRRTDEGFEYWHHVNDEWYKYILEHNVY